MKPALTARYQLRTTLAPRDGVVSALLSSAPSALRSRMFPVLRGESAYQVAVGEGFGGDISAWLASLKGDAGPSAYAVAVGNGFGGDVSAWLDSLQGEDGDPGASAYQVALDAGFSGDVTAWLASLKGAKGDPGDSAYAVAVDAGFGGDVNAWLASLVGATGAPGSQVRTSVLFPEWDDTLGVNGDYLLDTDGTSFANLYEKVTGVYGLVADLKGPQGLRGAATVVWNGVTPDNSVGADGDYYLATDGSTYASLYWKQAGAYGYLANVRGLDGIDGTDGEVTNASMATYVDGRLIGVYQPLIAPGTTAQFRRGDNAWSNVLEGQFAIGDAGETVVAGVGFTVSRDLTNTTTLVRRGAYYNGAVAIANSNTVGANYIETVASNTGSVGSLTALRHFYATQGAFARLVTSQYAFAVDSTLVGATNNYGFYGDLAAASNVWNFYANGTASNFFAGAIGHGSTSLSGYNFRAGKSITGAASFKAFAIDGTVQSDVTTQLSIFESNAAIAASAFTLSTIRHFYASPGTYGAGSAVTTAIGFDVSSTLANAAVTNVRAFSGQLASGTNRYNLYMVGTAMNYLAGNLGVGTLPLSSTSILISQAITGATSGYGVRSGGSVASDVTSAFRNISADTMGVAGSNPTGLATYASLCSAPPTVASGTVITNYFGCREESSNTAIAANMYAYWGQMAKETGGNFLSFTARTISNVDVTSNVATVTTSAVHGFAIGQIISHSFGSNTQLNGSRTIVATPTTTTYTFAITTADVASMVETGTATPIKKWGAYLSGTANNFFGGSVLIGTATPNDCAALVITSTTQGLLLPVHTTTQRNAVTTPTDGLILYDTTLDLLALRANGVWTTLQGRLPRIQTVASATSWTITADTTDFAEQTLLAGNLTINAPSGTPADGQELMGKVINGATPRTVTWNAIWRAVGVTLPANIAASKRFYFYAKYDGTSSTWDVLNIQVEA